MKRDNGPRNIEKFNDRLSQTDWSSLFSLADAQNAYYILHDRVTDIIKEVFPFKQFKTGYNTKISWLPTWMKNSILTKHELYATYRKIRTTASHAKYFSE